LLSETIFVKHWNVGNSTQNAQTYKNVGLQI